MKALSLWQPWASLLAHGVKIIETRSWHTSYRGPLLIHAGMKWNGGLLRLCQNELGIKDALRRIGITEEIGYSIGNGRTLAKPLIPFGAIIGRVNLVGCFETEKCRPVSDPSHAVNMLGASVEITAIERSLGNFALGRFAWVCRKPVVFSEPYMRCGMQGFFDVPDAIAEKLK